MLCDGRVGAVRLPDHIFELMWGGVRAMAHVRDGVVRLRGRNGIDLTPYFPELAVHPRATARRARRSSTARSSSSTPRATRRSTLLRPRLHAMADGDGGPPARPCPPNLKIKRIAGQLTFQAFDLLWLDGRSLHRPPALAAQEPAARGRHARRRVRGGRLRRRRRHRLLRGRRAAPARGHRREAEDQRLHARPPLEELAGDPGAAERRLRRRRLHVRRHAPQGRAVQPAAARRLRRRPLRVRRRRQRRSERRRGDASSSRCWSRSSSTSRRSSTRRRSRG